MSWVALAPRKRQKPVATGNVVTLSVNRASGRFQHRVYLTVRPALAAPALAWWTHQATVNVAIGREEHAGRLRITAGGPYAIMKPTGRRSTTGNINPPSLLIEDIPGMPEAGLARCRVDWEVLGDALIITLPWSGVKGVAKAAPLPVPPPQPVIATFVPGPEPKAAVRAAAAPERREPAAAIRPLASVEMGVMRKVASHKTRVPLTSLDARETGLLRRLEERGLAEYSPGQGWDITPLGRSRLQDVAGGPA